MQLQPSSAQLNSRFSKRSSKNKTQNQTHDQDVKPCEFNHRVLFILLLDIFHMFTNATSKAGYTSIYTAFSFILDTLISLIKLVLLSQITAALKYKIILTMCTYCYNELIPSGILLAQWQKKSSSSHLLGTPNKISFILMNIGV